MYLSFPVFNVVSNGSHFTADTHDGPIEGIGDFHLNTNMDGGTIIGSIERGPEKRLEKLVSITIHSTDGTYTMLDPC